MAFSWAGRLRVMRRTYGAGKDRRTLGTWGGADVSSLGRVVDIVVDLDVGCGITVQSRQRWIVLITVNEADVS